jgi:hypothetical protein
VIRTLALSALLAGCISVPDTTAPSCSADTDCGGNGEVCAEGVCYGDPPTGMFSGYLTPPAERTDLAAQELVALELPADGWLGDLAFSAPTVFRATLTATCTAPLVCASPAIDAMVTVTRPSRFAGGPGVKATAKVDPSTSAFAIPLQPTADGDDAYTLTIVPSGRDTEPANGEAPTIAMLVPPTRLHPTVSPGSTPNTYVLGGENLYIVSGSVLDAQQAPLADYRVVALGRWSTDETPDEISTIAYTDAYGQFAIAISADAVGNVELVARPPSTSTAATLHVPGVDPKHPVTHILSQPAYAGAALTTVVHVQGASSGGSITGVAGARVALVSSAATTGGTAVIEADGVTDEGGDATLTVLDGAAFASSYSLSIVPQASASIGVVYATAVADPHVIPAQTLPNRLALRGTVTDAGGLPLANVAVTAHPALGFAWKLDPAPQEFLASIPAPTAVTPDDGSFVLWVDQTIAGSWATYDLDFDPAATTDAASLRVANVDLPRDATLTADTLAATVLPVPARLHGHVIDPVGASLDGVDFKIFRPIEDTDLCMLANAPPGCPINAPPAGRDTSDQQGIVRVTLPRE